MKKGWKILLITLIVLLIGIAIYFILTGKNRFVNDPLYCLKDSDCTLQETSCNDCGCPIPVNIFNVKELECAPPSDGDIACTLYCPPTTSKCIYMKCTLNEEE